MLGKMMSAMGAIALAYPATAHAAWETAHGVAITEEGNCTGTPHNAPNQPDMIRNGDGARLRIPLGFRGAIEVYGHGIDFASRVRTVNGRQVTRERGVGGPTNLSRGCGSIGSIVVGFAISAGDRSGDDTLLIDDERIPITFFRPSITYTKWSDFSKRGQSLHPGSGGGGGGAPVNTAGPVVSTNNGQGCGPTSCNTSGGGGRVVIGRGAPSGGSTGERNPDAPSAIGKCIADVGGRLELGSSSSTITLPRSRGTADAQTCLRRPMIIESVLDDDTGDVYGPRTSGFIRPVSAPRHFMIVPDYAATPAGLTEPQPLSPEDQDFQKVAMTEDTIANFVGEVTYRIAPRSPVPGASDLTLTIKSDPSFGVRQLQQILFLVGRPSADFNADFTTAGTTGERQFGWRIEQRGDRAPAACFAQTTGTVTVPAGQTSGKVPLRATEANGCATARFALVLLPLPPSGAVTSAPYARTMEFAYGERMRPLQAPAAPATQLTPRVP